MQAGAGAIHDQSLHSFPREELVDFLSQLPTKDQQWALARLIADALGVPPHHCDNLRVRDPLLRHRAVLVGDEREDRVPKFRPCDVVNIVASHR
jgi:hypothetical protein